MRTRSDARTRRKLATETRRHGDNRPQSTQKVHADRFGGVAKRRAWPASDESANDRISGAFADSSDPATLAGLRGRPAAEPRRLRVSVSLWLTLSVSPGNSVSYPR